MLKKRIILTIIIVALVMVISGSWYYLANRNLCKKIKVFSTSGTFSQSDIQNSMYYGSLQEKKKGTPNNWVHIGEGTRSSQWVDPKAKNIKGYGDCGIYFK